MNESNGSNNGAEAVQAVRHVLRKCRQVLEASNEVDCLRALWHVSQLAKVLPEDLLRTVVHEVIKRSDFRLRVECCYLVARARLASQEFQDALANDPHPAVRNAFITLIGAAPVARTSTQISSSAQEFWTALPEIRDEWMAVQHGVPRHLDPKVQFIHAIKGAFSSWLREHPAPDEKRFFFGGRRLSAREIVAEVEQETPCGVEHVKMLTTWLLRRSSHDGQ